jgi:HCOMODA/2-hydroxy-3-carboxy-muconic semialdehyde decarboxylase
MRTAPIWTTTILLALACAMSAVLLEGQGGRGAGAAPGPTRAQVIEQLVLGNRILANEAVVDGTGHFSARDPTRSDRFLLSSAMAPAVVSADAIMEFDLDGNPIDRRGRPMYGERFIHAALYKARRDVGAVVHAHTTSLLPFANSRVPLRPVYQMSAFLHAGAPIFEIRNVPGETGMLVENMRSADALAKTVGAGTVALMRGHGAVIVGRNVVETVSNAVHLDLNARMQTNAAAVGAQMQYLSAEEARSYGNGGPYDRIWDHLKSRLPVTSADRRVPR